MSEQPRYFLDSADKIVSGQISADHIYWDYTLNAFVFGTLVAEDHFRRAEYLIASLENDISTGKVF